VLLPADMSGGVAVRTAPAVAEPAVIDLTFERGTPVAANRVVMAIGDLVASLDILATAHGVGAAAFGVLHIAHEALQAAALPAHADEFSGHVAEQYVRVLREGSWFTPLRQALDAYVDVIQQRVSGVVKLKMFQGECTVVSTELAALPQPARLPLVHVK
jgi:argininosuccinate synthase